MVRRATLGFESLADDLTKSRSFDSLVSRTLRFCCNALDCVRYIFRVRLSDMPS